MIKKVYILFILFLGFTTYSIAQTTIGIQDFEVIPATPTMTYTGGDLATGNGAFPNSPKYVSGVQGREVNDNIDNITYSSVDASLYNNIFFSCRLASFAGTSGNGADGSDFVIISVSSDGGATWSQELKVNGASSANAKWSFVSGTGTASSVYDGNNTTVNFAPAGSGNRTSDGYSTITVTNLPAVTNLRIRLEIKNNSGNEIWVVDDAIIKGTLSAPCSADPEPTTSSSTLTFPDTTCYSIDLSWLTGNGANTIVIASTSPVAGTPTDQTDYTANSTFGSGTTIAANEFVIHNGNGTSTTVTGLSATTTYYFAIFEYNGTLTNCEENYLVSSSLVGNFTTPVCPTSTNPEITGILVDACGGSEGVNEFLTFSNGNMPLSMNDLKVTFPFIPSYCNVGCGTNTWVTNPTYTSQLNTTAGCAGLFVEADPIPANANVIIFTGASPTFNFDFSGLCGTGPYYAIFANNTSTGGRFGNYNSDCTKYRETTIDFGTSQDTAVYQPCLLSSGAADGDYVAFSQDGTPTYSNDGCTPTATLPISLLYFKGKSLNTKTNLLEWTTTAEINNDYFTIERSGDAINFITIGTLAGAGNSNIQLYYQLIDDNPLIGINYYRLKQTDFNGDYQYANTIAIENNSNYNLVINNHTLTVITKSTNPTDKIEIYDAIGQLVYSANIYNKNAVNIQNFKQGIYIIKVGNATNYYIQKMKF